MADEDIRRYSAADIEAMIAASDYWPTSPDALEIELVKDFWRNARIVLPKGAPSLQSEPPRSTWTRTSSPGSAPRVAATRAA